MNIHVLENILLFLGSFTLFVFVVVVGVSAFYIGNNPTSCAVTLDPEIVTEQAPFDEPGLKQIGDNEYQLTVVTSAFNFDVGIKEKFCKFQKEQTVNVVFIREVK